MSVENQLMLQVSKGDQLAFRQLVKLASPKAYALAMRLMNGDSASAEDVLQDVLVKLWKSAQKWEDKGSVLGYIHRLVYTTSIDAIRKRKPTEEIVDDVIESHNPSAYDLLVQKEEHRMLYSLISTLPERQRSAMVLTYLQEMPQKDVALTLGTSVKAVESLLIRAKRTLKQTASQKGMTL